jgi:two-component system, chemotaxis family, CheB/CheR fusion protein
MTSPPDSPGDADEGRALNLVAIGASAGGIGALKRFFAEVPEETGIAFVVVMHLSPEHESQLASVLQPHVRLPVCQVRERTRIEPDHVYVIPPDRSMELTDGHLELAAFHEPRGRRSPIDTFFRTVAEIHPDGVGILLSGSGTDGVVGLKAIKELGGVIMAQSPDDAEYDVMPRSAIATGMVDFVLPAGELGARVVELRASGIPWQPPADPDAMAAEEAQVVRKILAQLRLRTGRDFTGYKKSTVLRRIGRRIQVTGSRDLSGYLEQLEGSASEAGALLKDLLISVTNFFRDPDAFDALEQAVIPELFMETTDRPVRVWVAGCATGEEAYSLAMMLAEHGASLPVPRPFQIFATDLDEEAIAFARNGLYPDGVTADIGEERVRQFFTREGTHLRVKRELRERILFSHHDLLRDPPFSRQDLVACRNLLIYLEKGLQDRVCDVFRYALRPEGFLFLGESESIQDGGDFHTRDREHRIYQRSRRAGESAGGLPDLPLDGGPRTAARSWPRSGGALAGTGDHTLHQTALERHGPPSVLVDWESTIVHSSESANRFLRFSSGTPSANIVKTVLPALRLELREALHEALEQGRVGRSQPMRVQIDGEACLVELHVAPAHVAEGGPMALVTFLEEPWTGDAATATDRTAPAGQQIEEAEAQLSTARSRIQQMMDASEHRQEELKASNEELQSINEEYKSTLEELETSKEELQSMNEELKTVNQELNGKLDELGQANDDLRNLMTATQIPTLFLDEQLRIKRFTPALLELFNLLPADVGRPLGHVTHKLHYPRLAADCERVLESLQPLEREVGNGGGHNWLARITPYRTGEDRIRGVVCTFTDVTRVRLAQKGVRQSEERFRALIQATAEIVWTMEPGGDVVEDSPSWRAFTGQNAAERRGWGWLDAVHPEDREELDEAWRSALGSAQTFQHEYRLRNAEQDAWRVVLGRVVPVLGPDGAIREWVGMSTDITDRKEAEESLRRAKASAEQAAEAKGQFLATMSHELRTPLTAVIGISDLLETGVLGPMTEEQQKHLGQVKTAAWHLVAIIEEVLTLSRLEAGRTMLRRGTVDVAEIAREVVNMARFNAEKKSLKLDLQGADRPVFAYSDAGKIRQITTNLVGNAVKFTEEGGIVVSVGEVDGHVEIQVSDTGPGVPPSQQETIFAPFVQGDSSMTREKGGSGLGLAVSRRLARALGGEIVLDTEPGNGCSFTLRIPHPRDGVHPT